MAYWCRGPLLKAPLKDERPGVRFAPQNALLDSSALPYAQFAQINHSTGFRANCNFQDRMSFADLGVPLPVINFCSPAHEFVGIKPPDLMVQARRENSTR